MSHRLEIFNVASVLAGRSSDGLAFVPDVIDRFEVGGTEASNRAACHAALMQLEKERYIELVAPKVFTGTTRQLALCPVSRLRGTLAWIRICNFDGLEDESGESL
jgi:hypothetical protein